MTLDELKLLKALLERGLDGNHPPTRLGIAIALGNINREIKLKEMDPRKAENND